MEIARSNAGPGTIAEEKWFDTARVLDAEWLELTVTTPAGEVVHYRIPRRTLFDDIDRMATSSIDG
jgi:hypothetical protein